MLIRDSMRERAMGVPKSTRYYEVGSDQVRRRICPYHDNDI